MVDWPFVTLGVVVAITILVYNLYQLKYASDPKDELLKIKKLLDEGLIEQGDYDKIKNKLVKKIIAD